ncbi:MAG: gamma carbonic anhydrase family protein [Alkaliphilus sp.]|nr:gamma carbonic anhydrase family protein [Alkaliphilus sp.]
MILAYQDHRPKIHDSCFIAENATVIGKVSIGENSSVWYGTVLRGDVSYIEIGENSNIQDNTVIHLNKDLPTLIGDNVTVGHGAIIHACTIKDNVLIGMGAIILDGAVIESNVIIGAGSLVPPGKLIKSNSLVVGTPAKVIRELTVSECEGIKKSAENYVKIANNHKY